MFNEKYLIKMAKGGDENAFEQIMTKYERLVYTIAYRNCGNMDDAMDISQEVFIKIYHSIAAFKENCSLSTWIFRIAINTCIDFSRKKEKNVPEVQIYMENSQVYTSESIDDGPLSYLENRERMEELQKAILRLPQEQRQILILRDIVGIDYHEIGNILNIADGTVKSRLSRAREKLRQILLSNGTIDKI